tara:strand:+ start:208 stop:501 length:294 start_codon:yes stop_codon:yes gene_type:complete
MKVLIVAIFSAGLLLTNPSIAEAKSKVSCKVSKANKKVICKSSKNIVRKRLQINAIKSCAKTYGKKKLNKRKPLKKLQLSSCKRGKCSKIKAKCNIK